MSAPQPPQRPSAPRQAPSLPANRAGGARAASGGGAPTSPLGDVGAMLPMLLEQARTKLARMTVSERYALAHRLVSMDAVLMRKLALDVLHCTFVAIEGRTPLDVEVIATEQLDGGIEAATDRVFRSDLCA